ncbi:PQQ-binding-like beta-propeller repeat protein, partial [Allosphingosinicella sp.]|uniref:PQQ-binding-like beta-propeller repeat protein n=1 Tax=Allosphingosinicella sp. TaxID=2823234 RepID=UPI002F09AC55
MKRIVIALTATTLLAGCGIFSGSSSPGTPTVGERISVLGGEAGVLADPELADVPVIVPAPVVNTEWTQSGGSASKSMGHLSLGSAPAAAWSVGIGQGSGNKARLASAPIVADGRIYTIDTQAVIRALNPQNGAVIWQTQLRGEGASAETLFGGGVSFANGRIYATNGAGDAGALDAATGSVIWRVRPGGPLRGSPTIGSPNVYVVSQDNQLFALNEATGESLWTRSGSVEASGVFGSAAPAFAQSTVVAGYSSG